MDRVVQHMISVQEDFFPVTAPSPKVTKILQESLPILITACRALTKSIEKVITSKQLDTLMRTPMKILQKDVDKMIALLPSLSDEEDQRIAYIWLTIIYRTIGRTYIELEKFDKILEATNMVIDLLEPAPKQFRFELILIDAYMEIEHFMLELKFGKDGTKKNIQMIKKYYDKIRQYTAEDKAVIEKSYKKYFDKVLRCGKGYETDIGTLINQYTLSVLICYKRYFGEVEKNMDKSIHYGILSLKYEVEYNLVGSPAEWIGDAVNFAIICRSQIAPSQADYLLRASQAMYEKHANTGTLKGRVNDPTYADDRFTKYLLDISFARQYFWLMLYGNYPPHKFQLQTENISIQGRCVRGDTMIEINGLGIKPEMIDLREYEGNIQKGKELLKKFKQHLRNIEEARLPNWIMVKLMYESERQKLDVIKQHMPFLED